MKTQSQQMLDLIEQMPDHVSAETISSELPFRVTVLRLGEEAQRGERLLSHEQATAGLLTG